MIPLRDNRINRVAPFVTWALIVLNVVIYLWDRQGNLFRENSLVFADLVMRPKEVVQALQDSNFRFPLVTLFTSMFMHGNLVHILANMVFLVVFGPNVEAALGS